MNKFVWRRRNKIKKYVLKHRHKELVRYNRQITNKYKALKLKDTDYIEVNVKESNGNRADFGFDILGQLRDLNKCEYTDYISDLSGILKSDDISLRIAFADENNYDENILSHFRENMNLFTLSVNRNFLINCGDMKLAFIGTSIPREGNMEDVSIDERILKNIAYAKNTEVDFLVVYVLRESCSNDSISAYEQKFIRKLAELECDLIVGSNSENISIRKNVKRTDGRYTDLIGSMGALFSIDKEHSEAIAVRIKFVKNRIDQEYIINKGYIPLFNSIEKDKINGVIRIDYHNSEHKRNVNIMNALTYIEERTGKLRDIRNILTIKDICDILNIGVPEKYQYLSNISVSRICARSFEVNSGDVFFFMEQFNDKNDGEPEPLERRYKVVEKAVRRGARFVFSYVDLDDDIPHVKLKNSRESHIKVCTALRQLYDLKTIGITGSVGKTSTKDMLYNVLSQKYIVGKNLRNSNVQVNIGQHVQNFRGNYDFFIQEIGGGRPGGASRHSRMILPEATIITNIGHAHIGNYGSQEKLMESKLEIIDGMNENGKLYLNADDEMLRKAKPAADTVFYGIDNKNADYYAEDISEEDGKTYFTVVNGDERIPAVLNVLGRYNVLNAVCCFAIGKQFGLSNEEIVDGIANFRTSGVRQNLINIAGYVLFVDCFNASPKSIDSSLSVLDKIQTNGRKIAVIGDVTGMGDLSHEIHEEIGKIIKSHCMDQVVCYGEESKTAYKEIRGSSVQAISITEPEELEAYLNKNAEPGDVVLFKGSSKMCLAERIDSLFGTMFSDQEHIDTVKYKKLKLNKIRYNLYPGYATVTRGSKRSSHLKIERKISDRRVCNIADSAFYGNDYLTKIKIPQGIRHIGEDSFSGCQSLKTLKLPDSVKFIGVGAFENCDALERVSLGKNIMHISKNAFKGCKSLKRVNIPSSVTMIEEDAFSECDNITLICREGSYCESYCKKNGIQAVIK